VPALFQRPTPVGSSPWAPNVAYVVESLVTYNGATYRALRAHTSVVGWDPPFTRALWTLVP
jgi:chitinase